jgi:hypothetical protein
LPRVSPASIRGQSLTRMGRDNPRTHETCKSLIGPLSHEAAVGRFNGNQHQLACRHLLSARRTRLIAVPETARPWTLGIASTFDHRFGERECRPRDRSRSSSHPAPRWGRGQARWWRIRRSARHASRTCPFRRAQHQ